MAWSFQRCELEFRRNRGRDRTRRTIDRNTRLRRVDGTTFAIQYHETDIVTIHADGRYTLRMGGYGTVSTKRRIEQYAPVQFMESRRATFAGEQRSVLRLRRVGGSITTDFREAMVVTATAVHLGSGALVLAPRRRNSTLVAATLRGILSTSGTQTGRIPRPVVPSRTVLTPTPPVTLAAEGRKVVSTLGRLVRAEARIKRVS